MSISYVGMAAAAANTVSLPSFQVGDLAIVQAYRNDSDTQASLPAGWTNINGGGLNTNSHRLGRRRLIGSDTGIGTWTNATHVQVIVLRGADDLTPIGANNLGGANNANLTSPSLTVQNTAGEAWLVMFGAAYGTDVNAKDLSGTTTRSGSVQQLALHTKANNTANWSSTAYSSAVSSGPWRAATIEVLPQVEGLIRALPLNDNAASTTVAASTGSNATLGGGDNTADKTTAGPGGSFTAGLRLNGSDDFIDIGTADANSSFQENRLRSVMIRVKFQTTGDTIIIGRSSGSTEGIWKIGDNVIRVAGASETKNFTVPALGTADYHTINVVHRINNDVLVFVDGVESSTGAQAMAGQTRLQYIGAAPSVFGLARYCDFRWWNTDQSANAATLHAEGVDPTPDVEPMFMATVRQAQSTSANANVDLAVTGAGRLTAGILWGSIADTNGTAKDSAEWGYGLFVGDGIGQSTVSYEADQCAFGEVVGHGTTQGSDGHRLRNTSSCIQGTGSGVTTITADLRAWDRITDGYRFRQLTAPAAARFVHGMFFYGGRAKHYIVPVATSDGGYVDVTVPWEPDLVAAFYQGDPFDDASGHVHHAGTIGGFAQYDGVSNWTYASSSLSHQNEDSTDPIVTANNFGVVNNDYLSYWDTRRDPSGRNWRISFSMVSPTVLRITTVEYGGDDLSISLLLLDTGGSACQIGMLPFGTGTGLQTPTLSPVPNFMPQGMLFLPGQMTALNTEAQNSSAGTSGFSGVTRPGLGGAGDAEFCMTVSNEQGVATTNSQSKSTNKVFDVPLHDGLTGYDATFDAFVAGGLRYNVGNAPGVIRYFPFLAMGESAGGGGGSGICCSMVGGRILGA